LSDAEVRLFDADGALQANADGFEISNAGKARLRRGGRVSRNAFLKQHAPLVARAVIDADGETRTVLSQASVAIRRLSALRDAVGKPWFSAAELTAAQMLRDDWDLS
jgi:hypothetical protein